MTSEHQEKLKEQQEHRKFIACVCKQQYETASEALYSSQTTNYINRIESSPQAYFCPFCSKYHLI